MSASEASEMIRKRAPSKRSLATRARVFDAAEKVFAERGFEGATIRDIAAEAGETIGSVHHHGEGKEALFRKVVARRADILSRARLEALERCQAGDVLTLEDVLSAFVRPFFDLCRHEPGWRHYARLVAYVSADDRWRAISAAYFDPTAEIFLAQIIRLVPDAPRGEVANGFVFCVASTLAVLTAQGRIETIAKANAEEDDQIAHLIRYCATGLRA